MKALLLFVSTRFLKLVKVFAHSDPVSERKCFGLGQFVVLLTLAPFIVNLTLYRLGDQNKSPSHYEYDAERFEPLPTLSSVYTKIFPEPPSYKKLNKNDSDELTRCNKVPFHQLIHPKSCHYVRSKASAYARENTKKKQAYVLQLYKFNANRAKYIAEIKAKYTAFNPNQAKPQPLPTIIVKQYTNNSISFMISDPQITNAWQVTSSLWLLGAMLIFPTLIRCVRRQQWGLLTFGLAIPAYNYLLTIPAIFFDIDQLSNWMITSSLAPQIAFGWFALKGQMRSKSFVYFLALMFACTFLPLLTNSIEAFSLLKAQLPLLVFIMVAAVARLIVKGARENAYLLQKLGWSRSLKTSLHAFILWLPMATLAIPFLYVTEVLIPQHWINYLHAKQVLVFDHTHDLLDNVLQSTALKTDDIVYAWHTKTQEIKKDIYDKKTKLNQADLEQSFQKKFDEIVPKDLVFEEHESDVRFVGFIIDLSVKASQSSTNKAYKTFRKSIRGSLRDEVADQEDKLKDSVNNNVSKAFEFIDVKYEEGKRAILKANFDTQTSLWWSINYLHAAHQLTLLFFAFICIKSFLYVFARVSFNRDTGSFVTLGDTNEANTDTTEPQIKPSGREYIINGDLDETYYISRRFQCRGKAPKFAIPQPFYAPIARLISGAYTMNKIQMKKSDDPVNCSATKGMEFFEWSLTKGETVIFDFDYFVGMSGNIKISTLISPRMSSLLLGKMIYSQATGPGKLILMAKGRAEIISSDGVGSLPPERLIAMHKNTRLHIDSELDPLNIYLSTAYIRPAGGGNIIVDVDSQHGSKSGLASFIKHFILPV